MLFNVEISKCIWNGIAYWTHKHQSNKNPTVCFWNSVCLRTALKPIMLYMASGLKVQCIKVNQVLSQYHKKDPCSSFYRVMTQRERILLVEWACAYSAWSNSTNRMHLCIVIVSFSLQCDFSPLVMFSLVFYAHWNSSVLVQKLVKGATLLSLYSRFQHTMANYWPRRWGQGLADSQWRHYSFSKEYKNFWWRLWDGCCYFVYSRFYCHAGSVYERWILLDWSVD